MNILINRTDAIGDTVLTLPMASYIKKNLPNSKVFFLISKKCEGLFTDHEFVDGYFVYDRSPNIFKKIWAIKNVFKKIKPDVYIYAGGGHTPTFISWLKNTKIRGGILSKWQSLLFLNKGIRQMRSMVAMHESEYNIELLKAIDPNLDLNTDLSVYSPGIKIAQEEKRQHIDAFNEFLTKQGLDNSLKFIVIHPGMSGHTLNWASRNYARYIYKMEQKFPGKFNFIISFTPSDETYLAGLKDEISKPSFSHLKKRIIFFNGAINGLRSYMSVLSKADFFLGPSTGTTHLANVLDVASLGLYSPIKVQSPARWAPFYKSEKSKVIVPDVICGEAVYCAGESCPYYECMAKIEVDDVVSQTQKLLE